MRAGRQGRPLFSILVVATFWAAILPPTHIHLAAAHHDDHDGDHHDDHRHAAAIEHAHWAAHRSLGAAVDDGEDEGRALFVDHPAVVSPILGDIEVPRAALLVLLIVPRPAVFTSGTRRISGNAPRDGPSRDVTFLRGPPFVL